MTRLFPAVAFLALLAAPMAAHAQLAGYGGGGHGGGGGCQSGGCGGGGHTGGGCHTGCGGGGHGGGGHGGGGHHGGGGRGGGDINININASSRAYAASDAYASSYSRSSAYAAQSDYYGGSQSQSIAYGSAFAGGGYGNGYGCTSACGVVPVGYTVAPYGPGGPFVTYTVIESRSYRREYSREEVRYRSSDGDDGGYRHDDGYAREDHSRGDYVRGYHNGYQTGYSDSYYSRDCDCYVQPQPLAPLPPVMPEREPVYVPSEPQSGCYRGGSGECG